MTALAHLRATVATKSRAESVRCSGDEVRRALGFDVAAMRRDGFDPGIIEEHETLNGVIDSFSSDSITAEYLTELTPRETHVASGVRILSLRSIRDEIVEGAAPGGFIFPHGYLVFATSIGGNAVCFRAQGGVVWADHDSFHEELIIYKDRATGNWEEVPFSPANIELGMVKLSDDAASFLADLLSDKLEKKLDSLDLE